MYNVTMASVNIYLLEIVMARVTAIPEPDASVGVIWSVTAAAPTVGVPVMVQSVLSVRPAGIVSPAVKAQDVTAALPTPEHVNVLVDIATSFE